MFTEGLDKSALRWVREVSFANFTFSLMFLPYVIALVNFNGSIVLASKYCNLLVFAKIKD